MLELPGDRNVIFCPNCYNTCSTANRWKSRGKHLSQFHLNRAKTMRFQPRTFLWMEKYQKLLMVKATRSSINNIGECLWILYLVLFLIALKLFAVVRLFYNNLWTLIHLLPHLNCLLQVTNSITINIKQKFIFQMLLITQQNFASNSNYKFDPRWITSFQTKHGQCEFEAWSVLWEWKRIRFKIAKIKVRIRMPTIDNREVKIKRMKLTGIY